MKKLIVAMACFGVMGACFAEGYIRGGCEEEKPCQMLPTTIDTTEEKNDFEIKEEKPKEQSAGVKVAHFLTGGLSTKIMSVVGKD